MKRRLMLGAIVPLVFSACDNNAWSEGTYYGVAVSSLGQLQLTVVNESRNDQRMSLAGLITCSGPAKISVNGDVMLVEPIPNPPSAYWCNIHTLVIKRVNDHTATTTVISTPIELMKQ